MSKFDVNWLKFTREYLPHFLRTNLVNLCYVLLRGIRTLYWRFSRNISQTDVALSYNSQYPNFQRLLNDQFDPALRRIKVYDYQQEEPFILAYAEEELKPIVIVGLKIVLPMNAYASYIGFVVELPDHVFSSDTEEKIKRLVNNYKFSSTIYKIIKN